MAGELEEQEKNVSREESDKDEDKEEREAFKAAGAEKLPDGRHGLRISGWEIESTNRSILTSLQYQQWEERLHTSHLPEMVFGESSLVLLHVKSGIKLHFNAFDALSGWKKEGLPPVEVPAAAHWKFRSKLFQQVILDYDYTFTTPYCGSETAEGVKECQMRGIPVDGSCSLQWEDSTEQIDVASLSSREPILFYDEVVLYEDELADNGVSLLTVKVRVMPSCWFLLQRFWLRVDGVLMRLRDTRMYCSFMNNADPTILRESCWREATFQYLAGFTREEVADLLGQWEQQKTKELEADLRERLTAEIQQQVRKKLRMLFFSSFNSKKRSSRNNWRIKEKSLGQSFKASKLLLPLLPPLFNLHQTDSLLTLLRMETQI